MVAFALSFAIDGNLFPKWIDFQKRRAQNGDPFARASYARKVWRKGGEVDERNTALAWCRDSADQGYPEDEAALAWIYVKNTDPPRTSDADHYARLAALQGNTTAIDLLVNEEKSW
jgi:TPR repeat protein